jgi:hypothetical protein
MELIHTTRPFGPLVHFLKSDEVRLDAVHDLRETRQIDDAVGAFAVMNVVSQDAQRSRDRSRMASSGQDESRDRDTRNASVHRQIPSDHLTPLHAANDALFPLHMSSQVSPALE